MNGYTRKVKKKRKESEKMILSFMKKLVRFVGK